MNPEFYLKRKEGLFMKSDNCRYKISGVSSKTRQKRHHVLRNVVLTLILLCIGCFVFLLVYTNETVQKENKIEEDFIPHNKPISNSEIPDTNPAAVEFDDSISEISETTDMSGDYIGNISCPLPPLDSVYRIYSNTNQDNSIVLYVENIDDGNFRFHFTKVIPSQTKTFDEDIIFLEHTAHYNGEGYYEYIDQEYHLYFRYRDEGDTAAQKVMEVYGLDPLYDTSQYNEPAQYNGLNGNVFHQGVPYAG